MDKKVSPGKIAGLIFCILAGICTVVLLFMDGYFSGQMKTVDKFFTSLTRNDINGFKSCVPKEEADLITEYYLERADGWLKEMVGFKDEEVKTSVAFVKREKLDNGVSNGYVVFFDLTLYNDNDHVTEQEQSLILLREGMKWVVSPE